MPKRSSGTSPRGSGGAVATRQIALRQLAAKLAALIPSGAVDAAAHETGLNRSTIYKWARGQQQPGAIDLAVLANYLGVMVSDLLEDKPLPREATPYERNAAYRHLINSLEQVSEADREEVIRQALWVVARIRVSALPTIVPLAENVIAFPTQPDDSGDFPPPPIEPSDFIEKDTDYPRPLHTWVLEVPEVAAGPPRHDDVLLPTSEAEVLNTFREAVPSTAREVRDDRVRVIKIYGNSMHPVLRNGWKVRIDPARSLFRPGKAIVMVYIKDEGSTIGLLAEDGKGGLKIVKRNPDYGGPVEIPLRAGEWYPVGTVTTIVEAPVDIE
jgi:transcriptional regulator with XRE-family HTH domain